MITNEERARRKWGHLPALQKIVEETASKELKQDIEIMSTCDTDFQRLARIAEVGSSVIVIAKQHRSLKTNETALLREDLYRLILDLEWAQGFFQYQQKEVYSYLNELSRLG